MSEKIGILLKTYKKDFEAVGTLLKSYNKYNRDNIKIFIVMPSSDVKDFITDMKILINENMMILPEEDYFSNWIEEEVSDKFEAYMKLGYLNQQIIKLSFWECGLCDNYFCIDSDGFFIRDFYISDFMYDENVPYTVLIEDNDLKADPLYYNKFWTHSREKMIPNIQREFGLEKKRLLTCHGFQIFSAKVLQDFKNNYMIPSELTYSQVLEKCALEFSWYNLWLQKKNIIPIHPCEPLFKVFHTDFQYIMTWLSGVDLHDLQRSYSGIVINSKTGIHVYDKPRNVICTLPINRIPLMMKIIVCSLYYPIFEKIRKWILKGINR